MLTHDAEMLVRGDREKLQPTSTRAAQRMAQAAIALEARV
jgi:hypothetical protein